MNETYDRLINRKAYYRGNDRGWYMDSDTEYLIIDVRKDGKAVQFDNGEWVGVAKIEIVENDKPVLNANQYGFDENDLDAMFNTAAGTAEARLDNEIARLEARIAELKKAREVLSSL